MRHYTLEDFPGMDSLYRLVNIAARRANQVNKAESRALVPTESKKPTTIALEEVYEGKIGYVTTEDGYEYDVG